MGGTRSAAVSEVVFCGPPAWFPVWVPTAEHGRLVAAASASDWPAYFAAKREVEVVSAPVEVERPAAEHTTLQPWPEGFAAPGGAVRLQKAAEALRWEVRLGYSRAFRKTVGRGAYVRCHFVGLWAQRGSQRVYGRWYAKADVEKLSWSWDGGTVNGWTADTVGEVTDALKV